MGISMKFLDGLKLGLVVTTVLGGIVTASVPAIAQATSGVILQRQGNLRPAQGEHLFTGTAGQTVAVTVTSTDFDPSLALIAPGGEEIAFNDDYARTTDPTIVITLPMSGTYKVLARSLSGQSGNYTVSIRVASPYDRAYYEGTTLYRQGNYPAAIAALNEAIRLDPNQPTVHLDLADVLYAEATRLKPDEIAGIVNSYRRALELYQQAGNAEMVRMLQDQISYFEQQAEFNTPATPSPATP